jgi:hypothetical protein
MLTLMNSTVSSLVARCLLDPCYLDRMARDPDEELAGLAVGAETRAAIAGLDVERVRLFAGFISMVQHNDLWADFPYTRALLRYYRAELATFADYRRRHLELSRAGKPSRAAKTTAFLDFLRTRLRDAEASAYPGLLDVLTHERLHWEVAQRLLGHRLPDRGHRLPDRGGPAPGPARADIRDGRVVVASDAIRVAALSYDPVEVMTRLRAGGEALTGLTPKAVCYCYWGRESEATVTVVAVDPATAAVLTAVDDRRAVHEVLDECQSLLPEADRRDIAAVLDEAVRHGLIRLIEFTAAME